VERVRLPVVRDIPARSRRRLRLSGVVQTRQAFVKTVADNDGLGVLQQRRIEAGGSTRVNRNSFSAPALVGLAPPLALPLGEALALPLGEALGELPLGEAEPALLLLLLQAARDAPRSAIAIIAETLFFSFIVRVPFLFHF